MTYLGTSGRQISDPHDGAGPALVGFGVIGAGIYLFTSAATVFAASIAAGVVVLVVIAAAVLLAIPVYRKYGWKSLSFLLLVAAALWSALGGVIVFQKHWLAFTPAAWVLNGLYLAALASGAWSIMNGWLKALAALFAAALVTATVVLPRPPGGEGPYDTSEKWTINIDAVDEHGEPLEGALVLCQAVLSWNKDLPLELSDTLARKTDRAGRIEPWEFDDDTRMKVVVCSVWKNANDGNAGYPPEVQFVMAPQGGGEYELHFKLTENQHPDVAYLTLDISGEYSSGWYFNFELWPGEPATSYVNSREGPPPLQAKPWNELRAGGFAIPANVAWQELRLRYFWEGPAGGEGFKPPHSEMQTIYIGPIAGGTRKKLSLVIPSQ